ncbi:MAG: hypothetical protein E5Y29_01070 [Mesorhizobium sp.]|nr:MAG: hypothetical protein EOQ96_23965 [Mesorhizobium sp.]TIN90078.1 MAG: hypothetical protein E5Y29_01070 [Mesorhizobium sp.]
MARLLAIRSPLLCKPFPFRQPVGGRVWDAVLPLLNNFARVPLCGMISHYNDDPYSTCCSMNSTFMKPRISHGGRQPVEGRRSDRPRRSPA